MNSRRFTTIAVVVILAIAAIGALWMYRREHYDENIQRGTQHFSTGYQLESGIHGYGDVLGDKRSQTEQNFGVDDSLAGVFSAHIMTPGETYTKIVNTSDDPRRASNLKLASYATCKLGCISGSEWKPRVL